MPAVTATCLCPLDSTAQKLAKINNNLVNLFNLMSAEEWTGQFVNLADCRCSDSLVLSAINNNIVNFFNWYSENPAGEGVQAGVEDLALNDASKAVVFPTAFAAAPAVVANLISPDGLGVIDVSPDDTTLTAAGVTFVFGALIPAAGWKLAWHAAEET